jgi:hypothetical protein
VHLEVVEVITVAVVVAIAVIAVVVVPAVAEALVVAKAAAVVTVVPVVAGPKHWKMGSQWPWQKPHQENEWRSGRHMMIMVAIIVLIVMKPLQAAPTSPAEDTQDQIEIPADAVVVMVEMDVRAQTYHLGNVPSMQTLIVNGNPAQPVQL